MTPLLFIFMNPAVAGQSHSASGYSGTYDLTCEDASLTLHLDLGWSVGGVTDSDGADLEVGLDCDGIDESEWQTLHDEVAGACEAVWPIADDCDQLGTDVADGVAAVNDGSLELLPESVAFKVYGTSNFWYRLFGVYPMYGTHQHPGGSTTRAWYLLNNNDGSRLGDFATVGGSLEGWAAGTSWACIDVALWAAAGNIDPDAGYELEADYAADRSVACGVTYGADALVAVLGLTFDGAVAGVRR